MFHSLTYRWANTEPSPDSSLGAPSSETSYCFQTRVVTISNFSIWNSTPQTPVSAPGLALVSGLLFRVPIALSKTSVPRKRSLWNQHNQILEYAKEEPSNHPQKLLPPQPTATRRSFLARAHKGQLRRCPAGCGDAPGKQGDAAGPLLPKPRLCGPAAAARARAGRGKALWWEAVPAALRGGAVRGLGSGAGARQLRRAAPSERAEGNAGRGCV